MATTQQQTNYGKIGNQRGNGPRRNYQHMNEYGSATAADRHFARKIHTAVCDVDGYRHGMVTGTETTLFFGALTKDAASVIEEAGGAVTNVELSPSVIYVDVVPTEEEQ